MVILPALMHAVQTYTRFEPPGVWILIRWRLGRHMRFVL